jgi:hypothetical protein
MATLPSFVAFQRADRFDGPTTRGRPASLDLDERHQMPTADDEIQIVPAQAEPVRLHVPATGRQVGDRRTLSRETPALPLVRPLCDRHEASAGSHGTRISAAWCRRCTESARSRTKFRVTARTADSA